VTLENWQVRRYDDTSKRPKIVCRNKKGVPEILPGNGHSGRPLDSLNVLCLPTLRTFGHVELHGLSFL
jgi:hypothetical protein